jgi:hypothetical protein
MPVFYSVSLAYNDIYGDYTTINPKTLIDDIPMRMSLALVCHYTAQLHTAETKPLKQLEIIDAWSARFPPAIKSKINAKIKDFTNKGFSNFNFFNNVSSLYCIEFLLENSNTLPLSSGLTSEQEENLFKLYIYFSAKWTKEQEAFMNTQNNNGIPVFDWTLALMLPFSELVEFKDFRLQFIKAIYFFKFCKSNTEFKEFLDIFLQTLSISTWQEYLINVVSVYVEALETESVKTIVQFKPNDMHIFHALENFFVEISTFKAKQDFLELRQTPLYKYSGNEFLILNTNFFVDKIYQGILFDFASVLIKAKAKYRGNVLTKLTEFIGIFGNDFVEQNLFYKIMESTFKRKGYQHYNGDKLKEMFGDGAPDYIVIDKHKAYIFEFKNTLFSAKAKYSYDPKSVKDEIYKKFVENTSGRPKGVTQLVNFFEDVTKDRYLRIMNRQSAKFTFYPIIVTTDFSFNLPTINKVLTDEFAAQIHAAKITDILEIMTLTLIDVDLLIKFQDLFKTMRLTLHRELNEFQKYLQKGTNSIDRALSFHRYLHDKTAKMKYSTPQIFFTEIAPLLQS